MKTSPLDKKTFSRFLATFSRAQIASIAASILDFFILIGLVELFSVWYVLAAALGAIAGAILNFTLNRHWSFSATHQRWEKQAIRYAVVSSGSLGLNVFGVWAFTEGLHVHYPISKAVTSLSVGLFFNFPLHRYWVFKKQTHD